MISGVFENAEVIDPFMTRNGDKGVRNEEDYIKMRHEVRWDAKDNRHIMQQNPGRERDNNTIMGDIKE